MTRRVLRVLLADISRLDISLAEARLSGSEIAAHAKTATDPVLKKQRLAAGLLIKEMLGIPDVRHTQLGAPVACGCDMLLSVSHSDRFVLVAALPLGCADGLGVDIEGEIHPERARRVEKRFLGYTKPRCGNIDKYKISYSLLSLDENGDAAECVDLDPEDGACISLSGESAYIRRAMPDSSATAKWCALEATLKTSGKGFGDIKALGELQNGTALDCLEIQHGCRLYSLAVAIKE